MRTLDASTAPPSGATVPYPALTRAGRDLLLVLAVALALRSIFALLIAGTYDYDEFVILLLSRDFAHGEVPYRDFMFFHPPGILVVYRLVEPLTALWWATGRAVCVLVDCATAGMVWWIGGRLYDRRTALAAGLLYAASPLALVSAARIGQDALMTALGLAGLACLLSRGRWPVAVVAGVLLGAAIWIKYPAVYFAPVYLLAAPRRSLLWASAATLTLVAGIAPFHSELHQIVWQTMTFQRNRWHMLLGVRLETVVVFWLLINPLAVVAVVRRRGPSWMSAGFLLGGLFLLSSQVYYHYFVPVVPFASLLSGPVLARYVRLPRLVLASLLLTVTLLSAVVIDFGGSSPLYITAASLRAIQPTIAVLDHDTRARQPVLADRYEYAYLARRPALDHYFWNVGVLVNARYLERHVSHAGAVVLSYGASSGYPAGFTDYLDARFGRVNTPATTVWLTRSQAAAGGRRSAPAWRVTK